MIMGACSQAKAEPQHYTCYESDVAGAQPQYYMVVEPKTGEFMLFDGTGRFINTSYWKNNAAMDNPKHHFVTNINGISLFFNLESEGAGDKIWSLVLFKEGYDPAKTYCF